MSRFRPRKPPFSTRRHLQITLRLLPLIRFPIPSPSGERGETYSADVGAAKGPSLTLPHSSVASGTRQWRGGWPGAVRARSASHSRRGDRSPTAARPHFKARLYLVFHLPDAPSSCALPPTTGPPGRGLRVRWALGGRGWWWWAPPRAPPSSSHSWSSSPAQPPLAV
jgi:hypothetical protein